jgi:antitoxin component HigA of HigAB toxin-antitoxin module
MCPETKSFPTANTTTGTSFTGKASGYARYEQERHAIEPASPKDALRFLLESLGLKQENLSGLVAQSNLSAILAGKRSISAALAGKLQPDACTFDASPVDNQLILFNC